MKYVFITITLLFFACQQNIQNQKIYDAGVKEISPGVYLKKIYVDQDRIYFLVDECGEPLRTTVTTSYDINSNKNKQNFSNTIIP